MKNQFLQNFIRTPKRVYFYSFLAVILALFTFFLLSYFQFYVHEYGHASSAILYSMAKNESNININFSYMDYKIPYLGINTKVPQQTITRFPEIMSIYGVLFTIIFYSLVFTMIAFFLSRKKAYDSKRIGILLIGLLVVLIENDIVLNLFCGTDGLDLHCSNGLLMILSGIFMFLLLVAIGYFYLELFILGKIKTKKEVK
jgi:hypothetical protein